MMILVVVESYHPLTKKEDERQQAFSVTSTACTRHWCNCGTLEPCSLVGSFQKFHAKDESVFEQKEVCRCKSGSREVAETEVEVDGSDEVTNKSQNFRWWCGSWVCLFG
jgi:hypothetical protein